jgi:nucleoside-diphosphate-sugar epimerase
MHVVIGSSGGLGCAVIRALLKRQARVRGVNRDGHADVPLGVELVAADASKLDELKQVCEGATVVYHCANALYTDWPRLFPPLTDNVIEAAAAAGAKLIFADNLYMYGPVSGAMHEELSDAATSRKGKVRAQMARDVLLAHRSGKVRAVIARASDFFGPGVTNAAMGERVFGAALRGTSIDLLGNIDAPHTYTFIDDFAQVLIALGERDDAFGEVWHAPNVPAISTRQFVQKVLEVTKTEPKIRVAPKLLVRLMGLYQPMMREIGEILYQFEDPFVVDHSKYEKKFGSQVTPIENAIEQTVAWFRTRSA